MNKRKNYLEEFVAANKNQLDKFYRQVDPSKLTFEDYCQKMFERYLEMAARKEPDFVGV